MAQGATSQSEALKHSIEQTERRLQTIEGDLHRTIPSLQAAILKVENDSSHIQRRTTDLVSMRDEMEARLTQTDAKLTDIEASRARNTARSERRLQDLEQTTLDAQSSTHSMQKLAHACDQLDLLQGRVDAIETQASTRLVAESSERGLLQRRRYHRSYPRYVRRHRALLPHFSNFKGSVRLMKPSLS